MAFCAVSEGKFHDECLAAWGVSPDDSADPLWCCPMCIQNDKAEHLLGADVDWDNVDASGDDTMALMKATKATFDALDPMKLKRAFELFKTVLRLVIEHEGGNHFKLHTGARKRRREEEADEGAIADVEASEGDARKRRREEEASEGAIADVTDSTTCFTPLLSWCITVCRMHRSTGCGTAAGAVATPQPGEVRHIPH